MRDVSACGSGGPGRNRTAVDGFAIRVEGSAGRRAAPGRSRPRARNAAAPLRLRRPTTGVAGAGRKGAAALHVATGVATVRERVELVGACILIVGFLAAAVLL